MAGEILIAALEFISRQPLDMEVQLPELTVALLVVPHIVQE